MRSVGFIGKTEKTDVVLYIAKMISAMGSKVIFIDATSTQKTRYTVPYIDIGNVQDQYVTEFDGVEVAVGFNNILELKKYLLSKGEDFSEFEYVLIDTDVEEMCEEYDIKSANKTFYITTYDKMHVAKGIELLKYLCATKRKEDPDGELNITKILMYTHVNSAHVKYMDQLTENLPIVWNQNSVTLSYDEGDLSVGIQNQYSNKIDMKYLSAQTREGIIGAVEMITGEDKNKLKKVLKNIDRNTKFFA